MAIISTPGQKNTVGELSKYNPAVDALLDRVLDEYGLVVCGWSATWDDALRRAVLRTKNRRFSTFWALRSEPTAEARELIDHRQAQVIEIESADQFFDAVAEKVKTPRNFPAASPTVDGGRCSDDETLLTLEREPNPPA